MVSTSPPPDGGGLNRSRGGSRNGDFYESEEYLQSDEHKLNVSKAGQQAVIMAKAEIKNYYSMIIQVVILIVVLSAIIKVVKYAKDRKKK